MKKFYLIASLCVAMCACNDNSFVNEPIQENDVVMSRAGESSSVGEYTVTPEMVCKYLNVARKGKNINSLNPIVENGDTLAYVAQYDESQGWDLISGDRRLDPILANAETGYLSLSDTTNIAVGIIRGIIKDVKIIKNNNNVQKHPIWKAFEPKINEVVNKPQTRGIGFGKWIAMDTVYESESYTKPHIIKTKWGQDYPWKYKTPRIDGVATKVGCVPVAVGQIIYHFRKNNHRNIALPQTAVFNNTYLGEPTGIPSFSNFSVNAWSEFKLNSQTAYNDQDVTVLFLSYLGNQMSTNYGILKSPTRSTNAFTTFTNFKLSYNIKYNYDFNCILSNLTLSKPVYMSFDTHSFIIDGYKYSADRMYISYMWDPNYELQEGDEVVDAPIDAINGKDGYAWREEEISFQESYSLMMNWGWDGDYDNLSYLAYSSSWWTRDESPIVRYYTPNWTAGNGTFTNMEFMLYDFCESE